MATSQYAIGPYLNNAVNVLRKFGIVSPKDEGTDIADLLEDITHVNPEKVTAIARVMEYTSTFNGVVRDQVADIRVGDRYADISSKFDSIQADARTLVDQLADGKVDTKERMANFWMRLTRGSIPKRFERIGTTFKDVQSDTAGSLEREDAILTAYGDFRVALGESRALAYELRDAQKATLDEAQHALQQAQQIVEAGKSGDKAELARLETARAEALRAYNLENSRYQLTLDVAVHLETSYNVGDTVMAKLQQTHDLKEQVHRRSVTFFRTHEHVFTALSATLTSQLGLHESARSLEAMTEGLNRSLETVAGIGTEIEAQARQVGYGALVSPKAVQILVDAIVKYQQDTVTDVAKLREESEKSAKEIADIVGDGKARVLKAITGFQAAGQLPPPQPSGQAG